MNAPLRGIALLCVLGAAASFSPSPILADGKLAQYSLPDVIAKSSSTTNLGGGMLLISSDDGGYLCKLSVNPSLFNQVEKDIDPSPEYLPQSSCISIRETNTNITGGK